jgi:hypothetical protein
MEPKDYTLVRIEGEYAYLREDGAPDASRDVFIALALLPVGSDVGSRLHCELFSYTLIN